MLKFKWFLPHFPHTIPTSTSALLVPQTMLGGPSEESRAGDRTRRNMCEPGRRTARQWMGWPPHPTSPNLQGQRAMKSIEIPGPNEGFWQRLFLI